MPNAQIQIKISLSPQLNSLVASKAASLGLPVSQFVKHLLIKEIEEEKYPVYKASKRLEKITKQALKDRHKAIRVDNIEEFFKNL